MDAVEAGPLQHTAHLAKNRIMRQHISTWIAVGIALVAVILWTLCPTLSTWFEEMLTTVSESPSRFTVDNKDLSSCGLTRNQAGYIQLENRPSVDYFYWYVESRSVPTEDPLVIWLAGGPGCSSMSSALRELGPCHIDHNLSTWFNQHSWTSEANVVFVDQPTHTGFSTGRFFDYEVNEEGVMDNFYSFLQGFYIKHPELIGRDVYIAGESYAGHYIPAIALYLWEQSQRLKRDSIQIALRGIVIGNGLVNPAVQGSHMLDMVEKNNYGIKLIDDETHAKAEKELIHCVRLAHECQSSSISCVRAAICAQDIMSILTSTHRSAYDIRKQCSSEDANPCYDITAVTAFLNSKHVQTYFNVSMRWHECSDAVTMAFATDLMKSYEDNVAKLLDDVKIRVLVYYGDADLTCNWYGGQAWTLGMEWSGKSGFNSVEEHPFMVALNGELKSAGSVRHFNRLTFLRVFEAGHQVPVDQPAIALTMINKFLKNELL